MPSFVIVAIGIAIVLLLIIKLRINAFIALITAALAVSFMADGVLTEKVSRVASEFGTAAGKIGLVIGFAAVIGEAMMRSGAADRIVQAFLRVLGEKRAPWALMGSGFVLSVPVFFDTVFYLLIPLARSLYRKTGRNFLLYVMAISAGGAITHTLVPPTPGPLQMAITLDISVGLMILVGAMVAVPAAIAGILFATFLDKTVMIEALETTLGNDADTTTDNPSADTEVSSIPLWEALLPVILPVLLISGDTVVGTMMNKGVTAVVQSVNEQQISVDVGEETGIMIPAQPQQFANGQMPAVADEISVVLNTGDEQAVATASLVEPNFFNDLKPATTILGNPSLALLFSMAISLLTWVRHRTPTGKEFSEAVETALLSGGLVILITAAGGAFGGMLKLTGISSDIQTMFAGSGAVGLVSLFLAFGMAALLKVAQGSSTTAMITVSAMMAAMHLTPEQLGFNMVYIATAIGAGSLIGSWMNDSGFWIVAKMSGLSEAEALKTWTPLLVVLGAVSLLMTIILSFVLPLTSVA